MGQVLHGSATTTGTVRRAVQESQESLSALASATGSEGGRRWKKRSSGTDLPTGPRTPASTVLSVEKEAIVTTFCRHALPPRDDCLYALQAVVPQLMALADIGTETIIRSTEAEKR